MDKVAEEVETVKKEWNDTYHQILDHINEIQLYGKIKQNNNNNEATDQDEEEKKKNSLPRLNAMAQDELTLLSSLQFKLDLLAPQLLSDSEIVATQSLLQSWKTQLQNLRLSLRNANMQAKANMREAALEERERLLGGGEESTIRRRQLQTKAGMTSAAESITESLRRTRQLMVQEVERTASTLETFEESTGVLKKAESEYKGHRSLLTRTRNLLSTMQRQDVMDRIILGVGFFFFSLAVLYVISKRIGLLKLQRTVTAAIKAGMVRQAEHVPRDIPDGRNPVQANEDLVHRVAAMRDEL